jgi:hypothetical protein
MDPVRMNDLATVEPVDAPPPLPPASPTPVVPLDYSPREERSARKHRVVNFLRRLSISTGVALMAGAVGVILFPYKDEEVALFCVGLGLVLLAVPLPKISRW